jgi:hypothetical protein
MSNTRKKVQVLERKKSLSRLVLFCLLSELLESCMGVQVHDHRGLLASVRLHFQFSCHLHQKNVHQIKSMGGGKGLEKRLFFLRRRETKHNLNFTLFLLSLLIKNA